MYCVTAEENDPDTMCYSAADPVHHIQDLELDYNSAEQMASPPLDRAVP